MNTQKKHSLHDVVRGKGKHSTLTGAIRGWERSADDKGWVCVIRLADGQELKLPEDDLEATGESEAPLRFDEVVEIFPRDVKYAHLSGQRAVVVGMSVDDARNIWWFAVSDQKGETYSFEQSELRSIGKFLPNDEATRRRGGTVVKVYVDTSGKGDIAPGMDAVNIHKYTSFQVNLKEL